MVSDIGASAAMSTHSSIMRPKGSPFEAEQREETDATPHALPNPLVEEALTRIYDGVGSRSEAEAAFEMMDRDGSGSLDQGEFTRVLQRLHLHLNERQVAAVMEALDEDSDGLIDAAEFLQMVWHGKMERVRSKFRASSYKQGGQDWTALFRHYDRDNSGGLDFDEFRRACRKDARIRKADVSDEELTEMFEHVDGDGGGTIGLAEFVELLGSSAPSLHREPC